MTSAEGTHVSVRYFAAAAEAAGCEEETLSIEPPTVGTLRDLLAARYGEAMTRVLSSGSFLVDGVATRDVSRIVEARVDVLPPFAGG
ncbi:MAG: MoaD/ThiS family protein [Humibacter sp.]